MSDTRMPTQKRSIEKRNRIIEKGFELMCEKGYYNVSTPDIAEAAEVSTGIIYQYFNDKKDIFIEGVKNYSNSIMFPMHSVLENEDLKIDNIEAVVRRMIEAYVKSHTISKKAHEELMAMSHLDEDVANIFKNSELELTNKIVSIIKNNNIKIKNPIEKIHIAIGIIENLCHELVYHKHKDLDYNAMQDEVVKIITNILKK
ncbi:MAG: TetR/AcrR family transcriptional regulator [Clostridia bacterium]|nr:TetR/AcrR family transcriptional regulator [Clostridia bacterium]